MNPSLQAALRLRHAAITSARRSFRTSSVARGGGGADEPAYLHAKHMYDLKSMTNRKLKIGAWCVGGIIVGFGTPIFAVTFQQRKG